MKRLFFLLASSSILMSCANPESPFYWAPIGEITPQKPTENTDSAGSKTATTTTTTPKDLKTPEPIEIVKIKEVEPAKKNIQEIKKIDNGTTVCMQNDILTNDFEVLNPGTKGQIIKKNNKVYFETGGREFDITNVPAPTTPC